MACFTYIIYSVQLQKYYIGHTCNDISTRINKHLSSQSRFTSKAKDWQLVYEEKFENKSQAYQRELEIKRWKSKQRIIALIEKSS